MARQYMETGIRPKRSMQEITTKQSLFRRPSRGELIFVGILTALFLLIGSGRDLPFAPIDWFQQRAVAQVNLKEYNGTGVVIAIDDDTFAKLERTEWTRSDLADLLEQISAAKPDKVVVSRQYFADTADAGVDRLRATLGSLPVEVFWEVAASSTEMSRLLATTQVPDEGQYNPSDISIDPGAQGLAEPVAMAFLPTPQTAPLQVWYSIEVDETLLRSTAQVLADSSKPSSNRFDVDLAYDPAAIPVYNAADILAGEVDASQLEGREIIIAFTNNIARDALQTPAMAYTSRAAATLMAAKTLNDGPPVHIGWFPAWIFSLLGVLAWLVLRRPIGRWVAFGIVVILLISPFWLQQNLIFQFTSHGLMMLFVFAVARIWMRGRKAVQTYRSAAESKSQFLAQASHDLRQPIHAIGLLSERLSQTDLTPDQAELVSKISWSVDNASQMFRALLDIAAIESGTLQTDIRPVAMNDILAGIDNQNALAADQAKVDLRLVPSDHIVATDPALLGTMLQNLVSNAIRYSPGRSVLVGCRNKGGKIAIFVVDNGKGISSSELKNVKKEFYRSSGSANLRSDNKGLGLAIVNRLARALGLNFVLRSREGKGTTASIEGLSLATETLASIKAPSPGRLPLAGMRVALADDDLETLRSTQRLLEQWGCEVEPHAHFPHSGIKADVFLSDFDFGAGDTLAGRSEELRELAEKNIPVIVVSGHHPDQIREAVENDSTLILAKPLRAAELRSALMSVRLS